MILLTQDASGTKKYFAGFYRDNSLCWSTQEHTALDKSLAELSTIVQRSTLGNYVIRERMAIKPTYYVS